MIAVGLDVHQKKTTVAYLDTDTGEITKRTVATNMLPDELSGCDGQMHVALEVSSTGIFVARELISCGLEVSLVAAYRSHRVLEGINRRNKTDSLDAVGLARIVAGGMAEELAVWVPDEQTRQLRALTRGRESLVHITTRLRNQLRALFRAQGRDCPYTDLTGRQARDWIAQFIAQSPDIDQWHCTMLFEELLHVKELICQYEHKIKSVTEGCDQVRQLMTIDGCGIVLASTIAAEIGSIVRFASAKHLCSYSGLAPRVKQSGERSHTEPLAKQGNPHLRRALVLLAQHVAWTKALKDTTLKIGYYRQLNRHGPNPAKVDLARRLCRIIFAMWRDGTDFIPELVAT